VRSKRYRMLLKVPCKFLIFRWLKNCQGSGVGSIPIGRSNPPKLHLLSVPIRATVKGYIALEFHLCSESEDDSALRSSSHVRVILDYRLNKEHW
jgi:hypothetical protein